MKLAQQLTRSRRSFWPMSTVNFEGTTYPLTVPQQTLGFKEEEIQPLYASVAAQAYKANPVVFAAVEFRRRIFSQAKLQWQQLRGGVPGKLFGSPALQVLEEPWPDATTSDLLGRMLQDADLAGNAFVVRQGDRLRPLRPDWVSIVAASRDYPDQGLAAIDAEVVGYAYWPGGKTIGADPVALLPEEVCHFAPTPDPTASFRGWSWVNVAIRDIMGDQAATTHKLKFWELGATPNLVVSLDPAITLEKFEAWVQKFDQRHQGVLNAYRTLYLGGGADAKPVGSSLRQADFKTVQGAGETRIAAAAGTPPVLLGLSEGLSAATYCLPASEHVWTLDGPRSIADIRPGDEVWAVGDDKIRSSRVTWQGRVGEKLVYRIRTKNRILRATDNHPVLVRIPGHSEGHNRDRHARTEWRAVGDLRPGDEVVEPSYLPDAGGVAHHDVTPALVRWLGAYMGDGSGASSGALSIAMPPDDRVRGYYEGLTRDIFGRDPQPDVRSFRFHDKAAGRLLVELGFGGVAKTKRIPGWVFRLPLRLRLEFLAGLIDSDGSVDKRGVGALGFANRMLVEQARMLFVASGVQVSNVTYREQSAAGLPNPGIHDSYDFWSFAITTGLGMVPTADKVYQDRLARRRDAPEGHDAANAGLEGLSFYTVRSIEPEGAQPVYDISVAGDASFIAEGIAVHNSNYGMARRSFSDGTLWPLWTNLAGSLQSIIPPPPGARLWVDGRSIPFLAEDEKDRAETQQMDAAAIGSLIQNGYKPDAVIDAITANDLSRLVGQHTNLLPIQMQAPGESTEGQVASARAELVAEGIVRPTDAQVAKRLGVSERTIRRWKA